MDIFLYYSCVLNKSTVRQVMLTESERKDKGTESGKFTIQIEVIYKVIKGNGQTDGQTE